MFLVNQTVKMLEVVGSLVKHTVKMLELLRFLSHARSKCGISRVDAVKMLEL